eukprot:2838260-Rhodomonas_salina.1
MSASCLRPRYAMPGTHVAYGRWRGWLKRCKALLLRSRYTSLRCPVLTYRMELSAYAYAMRCSALASPMVVFAVYGTDLAYGSICLRARYAMSGTGIAYGGGCLHACYEMYGTDIV